MSNNKHDQRVKRKRRIRRHVTGTSSQPRLSVFRSAMHVYAQAIDDDTGSTLVGLSSVKKGNKKKTNSKVCEQLGETFAKKCLEKNISKVVFDRNGFVYHGRIKAFAEGARKGGLQF